MNNSKIISIIILRAIAALCVCAIHIKMFCDFHVNSIIDYIIDNGQLGVAIFFVISGFILPYSLYKKNYRLRDFFTFLLKRSIRIDPPYWCIIGLLFVTGITPVSMLSLKTIALHLFYLVPFIPGANWYMGIFWTLSIEFQFYLLLGLFFPFLMRIKVNISILFLIGINLICILSKFTHRGIIVDQMSNFVIGFIAFLAYVKRISLIKGLLLLSVLSTYIMIAVSIKSGTLPLVVAVFILLYKTKREIQPLVFIGNISYSLYLIHPIASELFLKSAGLYITNKSLLFVGCLFASILCASVFYFLIERKALNYSKKLH